MGTVLGGRWHLEQRIATGGMSAVYAAVHRTTRLRVAVKILNPDKAMVDEVRSRFEREAARTNGIQHDGVVRAFDDGETSDGCPYMVLELLEGETLEERRVRLGGRLPVADVIDIGIAIARVLTAAHEAGLVHRDVKPANVFLTKQGVVKLLDFGVAGRRPTGARDENSVTGWGCGTPRFMAPEQLTGAHTIDARADVFSLATTMYRTLTGAFPYPATTIGEYLFALRRHVPIAPSRIVPGVSPALDAALARALSPDPGARFADARAFVDALLEPMPYQEHTAVMRPRSLVTTLPSATHARRSSAPAIAAIALFSFVATVSSVVALNWPAISALAASGVVR